MIKYFKNIILSFWNKPKLYVDLDGIKVWYLNGKYHRIDGPAIIYSDGTKFWYLNGKMYTYEEWFNKLTPEQQLNYLWNLDEE